MRESKLGHPGLRVEYESVSFELVSLDLRHLDPTDYLIFFGSSRFFFGSRFVRV